MVIHRLVVKVRLEKMEFQVFLVCGGHRGHKVLLETMASQGPLVKKVSFYHRHD